MHSAFLHVILGASWMSVGNLDVAVNATLPIHSL